MYLARKILEHSRVCDEVVFYGKRVVADRLYRRAYGTYRLCSAVEAVVTRLLADAACDSKYIPAVVHDNECTLDELFAVRGEGRVIGAEAGIWILEHLSEPFLHSKVLVEIRGVAAASELIPCFVVGYAEFCGKIGDYLIYRRVNIPVLGHGV